MQIILSLLSDKKIADKNWVLTAYDETSADGGNSAITAANQGKAAPATEISEGKGKKNISEGKEPKLKPTEESKYAEVEKPEAVECEKKVGEVTEDKKDYPRAVVTSQPTQFRSISAYTGAI